MHWSRPAAVATLEALRRLGGSATTKQIQQETDYCAVNSAISSLRRYLVEDLGWSKQDVRCEYSHTTENNRRVYVYTLSHRAMFGAERQAGLFSQEGSDE